MHTTNYHDTFIEIAPTARRQQPKSRPKRLIAKLSRGFSTT